LNEYDTFYSKFSEIVDNGVLNCANMTECYVWSWLLSIGQA